MPDSPPSTRQTASDARQDAADASTDDLREMVGSLAVTVDKLSVNVDRMVVEGGLSREAMANLSASNQTLAQKNRAKLGVIITLVALVVAAGFFGWRLQAQGTCFANWANDSTSRTGALGPLSNARYAASSDIVSYAAMNAIQGKVGNLSRLQQLQKKLDDATNAYNAAYAENPVPTSPKFNCAAF